jgi:hypothetical protein
MKMISRKTEQPKEDLLANYKPQSDDDGGYYGGGRGGRSGGSRSRSSNSSNSRGGSWGPRGNDRRRY